MSLFTVATAFGLVISTLGPWPDNEAGKKNCYASAVETQQRVDTEDVRKQLAEATGRPVHPGDLKVRCLELPKAPQTNSQFDME